MTKEQTQQILAIFKTYYPQSFKGWSNEQSQLYLSMWAEALKDEDAMLVTAAVKAIINTDTREFAPNIAQVKQKMIELSDPNSHMTEEEAWSYILKAIRKSGWHSEEAYAELPEVLQSLTSPDQLHEWSQMDSEVINSVVSSNFRRSFKTRFEQYKTYKALPNDIKQIAQSFKNSALKLKTDWKQYLIEEK